MGADPPQRGGTPGPYPPSTKIPAFRLVPSAPTCMSTAGREHQQFFCRVFARCPDLAGRGGRRPVTATPTCGFAVYLGALCGWIGVGGDGGAAPLPCFPSVRSALRVAGGPRGRRAVRPEVCATGVPPGPFHHFPGPFTSTRE